MNVPNTSPQPPSDHFRIAAEKARSALEAAAIVGLFPVVASFTAPFVLVPFFGETALEGRRRDARGVGRIARGGIEDAKAAVEAALLGAGQVLSR